MIFFANFCTKGSIDWRYTVETRIKEPVFIRTLRLKFDLSNSLNKNHSEAEIGGGSYITGLCLQNFSELLRIHGILIRILEW